MKKYFIFAAVAAAGLLTSCSSSDDIAANDAQNPIEDPDARQAIRLNIGNVVDMSVRGPASLSMCLCLLRVLTRLKLKKQHIMLM